jgi:protein tyrosine phosphatase (PTP) superfamily phosphohydrolase (DUF442 family)
MIHSRKTYVLIGLLAIIVAGIIFFMSHKPALAPKTSEIPTSNKQPVEISTPQPTEPQISLIGPRGNVPDSAPKDYGFWSFAVPVPGVLSRSGQPTIADFKWLKANGWKSDIDLRIDGDHDEVSDDADISGFSALGLNYLKIQMLDGAAPTDQQAEQFLKFVTDPANQPAHVHCRGGIGRAGIMVAIYRYAVQGWPMEETIKESVLFQGGISDGQKKWFAKYAAAHTPGSFGN